MFFFCHLSVLAVSSWPAECYRLTDSQRKCQCLSESLPGLTDAEGLVDNVSVGNMLNVKALHEN